MNNSIQIKTASEEFINIPNNYYITESEDDVVITNPVLISVHLGGMSVAFFLVNTECIEEAFNLFCDSEHGHLIHASDDAIEESPDALIPLGNESTPCELNMDCVHAQTCQLSL